MNKKIIKEQENNIHSNVRTEVHDIQLSYIIKCKLSKKSLHRRGDMSNTT